MKRAICAVIGSCLMISIGSVAYAAGDCSVDDMRCLQKKLTVEMGLRGILKDAAESAASRVDDSYMKGTLATMLEACAKKPDLDSSAVPSETKADKMIVELTEVEMERQCYQDVLSNQFIIDISAEAIIDSVAKTLWK